MHLAENVYFSMAKERTTFTLWEKLQGLIQGINFKEEVKTLALLLSLPTSWEVFYTTFANNYSKINLDKTIRQYSLAI